MCSRSREGTLGRVVPPRSREYTGQSYPTLGSRILGYSGLAGVESWVILGVLPVQSRARIAQIPLKELSRTGVIHVRFLVILVPRVNSGPESAPRCRSEPRVGGKPRVVEFLPANRVGWESGKKEQE